MKHFADTFANTFNPYPAEFPDTDLPTDHFWYRPLSTLVISSWGFEMDVIIE